MLSSVQTTPDEPRAELYTVDPEHPDNVRLLAVFQKAAWPDWWSALP